MNGSTTIIPTDILMLIIVLTCTIVVFVLSRMQRLTKGALPISLGFALAANYGLPGLRGATIGEMALRITLSYIIIRIAGTLLGQLTTGAPATIRYSSQQPKIEFEEVA